VEIVNAKRKSAGKSLQQLGSLYRGITAMNPPKDATTEQIPSCM